MQVFRFVFLIFLPFSSLQSVICRHDVPETLYLNFSNQKQFAPVGCVNCRGLSSTGTLISPSTVLVSAHAIRNNDIGFFRVFHPIKQKIIKVQGRTIRHSNYHRETNLNNQVVSLFNDIGLLILDTPINDIEPANLWYEEVIQNTSCIGCGFGKPGNGLTGPKPSDFIKRAFTNSIEGIINDPNYDTFYAIIFNSPNDNFPITPLEGIGSEGDSGAPIFIQAPNENSPMALEEIFESKECFNKSSPSSEYVVVGILNLLVMKGFYHSYNTILPIANFREWIEENKR